MKVLREPRILGVALAAVGILVLVIGLSWTGSGSGELVEGETAAQSSRNIPLIVVGAVVAMMGAAAALLGTGSPERSDYRRGAVQGPAPDTHPKKMPKTNTDNFDEDD